MPRSEMAIWLQAIRDARAYGTWTCTVQGKKLEVKYKDHPRKPPPKKRRQPITTFTRKSRFRLLKNIAVIDWREVGKSLLVTLTYPDACVHFNPDTRNREKYLFMRSVENYLGAKVSGVWRVEYKIRKSGSRQGLIAPHIHLMLFGTKFVPSVLLRQWWNQAIGNEGPLSLDVQAVKEGEAASVYVSKYCGKVDDNLRLDNVPYLNKTGRHWGLMRKDGIKRHKAFTFPLVSEELIHYVRAKAGVKLKYLDLRFKESFTLLGEFAKSLGDEIMAKALDSERAAL